VGGNRNDEAVGDLLNVGNPLFFHAIIKEFQHPGEHCRNFGPLLLPLPPACRPQQLADCFFNAFQPLQDQLEIVAAKDRIVALPLEKADAVKQAAQRIVDPMGDA